MNKRDDISYYIGQVLSGNTGAYTRIVELHRDKAFNLAYRICCNREEAEEVAQDAFLKAYRSLATFQGKSSFSTWLYRIVYNTAVSNVRSKKKEILSLEDFPADATDFMGTGMSEEKAEEEYRKSLVDFAFRKLAEEERSIIALHYYEDMSIEDISGVTGISKANVKVKLFRARQKMQGILEKAGYNNTRRHEYTGGVQR